MTQRTTKNPVLISWVARANDPYHRDRDRDGKCVPGPTLTLLFDDGSPYKGRVQNAVLLHTEGDPTNELKAAIHEQSPAVKIEFTCWKAEDPTDHSAIFEFLRTQIPSIREKYRGRELLIHVSPGTPSMQTIWVLMGTTGFIESHSSWSNRTVKTSVKADALSNLSNSLSSKPFTWHTRLPSLARSPLRNKTSVGIPRTSAPRP